MDEITKTGLFVQTLIPRSRIIAKDFEHGLLATDSPRLNPTSIGVAVRHSTGRHRKTKDPGQKQTG
jgi:hypothetical protein